ncbi:MAG: hypothetical protein ACRC6V_05000 [Bacteroidales bacterium]
MPKKVRKKYGAVICPFCKSRAGMISLFGSSRCIDCQKEIVSSHIG